MTTVKLTSILAGLLTATLAWAAEQNVSSQDDLAHAFAAPPHEAKPWVYWWFLGGYGNPEGMARDIAAMKEKGIGVHDTLIGNFATCQEMAGFSISLLKLDGELRRYYDMPATCPGLTKR